MTDLRMPERYQEGFNFTYVTRTAFDVNGDYRWFLNDERDVFQQKMFVLYKTLYENGKIILPYGSYHEGDVLFFEMNLLGKLYGLYYSPYGMHHCMTFMDNGNLLVLGSCGDTIEDFVYEIDWATGEIVNAMDFKHILQRTREIGVYNPADWLHMNSIFYQDGHIVVSGRQQSAVVKVSWPEGEISWIMAEHHGWLPMFQKYLLKPIGDEFEWQHTQHSAWIIPNNLNNPNVIDLILFDNGNLRFHNNRELLRAVNNHEIVMPENYSRLVHYRINEATMEIEQIWQWGKEMGNVYYAGYRSSVQALDNGNMFGTFIIGRHSLCVEIYGQDEIVWESYKTTDEAVSNFTEYRVSRLPIYSARANNLEIGIPVRNLIPQELMREFVR
jgi:hypothetical protein